MRVGLALGVVSAGLAFVIPKVMSTDAEVAWLATQAMWITSAAMPVAAVAYMLDGVLIGAGDTRKLASYMLIALAALLPWQFSPGRAKLGYTRHVAAVGRICSDFYVGAGCDDEMADTLRRLDGLEIVDIQTT